VDSRGDRQDLNLLVQDPQQRIGRRGLLRVGALLGAAAVAGGVAGGAAGYLGGRAAGRTSAAEEPPDAAAGTVGGPRRRERLLNIYNWSDYIDEVTIPRYQA
jgi:spermidine/putrescine-binding protein